MLESSSPRSFLRAAVLPPLALEIVELTIRPRMGGEAWYAPHSLSEGLNQALGVRLGVHRGECSGGQALVPSLPGIAGTLVAAFYAPSFADRALQREENSATFGRPS